MKYMLEGPPQIIAFEGPDGAGKTTLINAMQDRCDDLGIKTKRVSMIAECPSRELLLHSEMKHTAVERLLLVTLCRIEAERQCRAALESGHWVLLDRCQISRAVYQGRADGLTDKLTHTDSITGPFPNIEHLVYIDVPFSVLTERLMARGSLDNIESLGGSHRFRVYENYGIEIENFRMLQDHYKQCKMYYTDLHCVSGEDDPDFTAAMLLSGIEDAITERKIRK